MSKDQITYDVIIVGAGLAGLTAAYHLKERNDRLNVLIIEGKSRIGGRTQTVELKVDKNGSKANFDLGGQWITDSQKNINKLLKKFNIDTYKQFDTGKKILESNKTLYNYTNKLSISPLSLIDLNAIKTKFNIASDRLNTLYPFENVNLANHLDEISLSQYLYSNSISTNARAIIENAVRSIYGFESTHLNALFALMNGKTGGSLTKQNLNREKKVIGGTQQLCHKLLEFVLNSKPSKIVMNSELIEINQEFTSFCQLTVRNTSTGLKEKFYCKKVISSIPVNQYINVRFEPQLPAYKLNVFKFMQFGNYIKFIITYEKPFWRNKGYSGEVISDGSNINQSGQYWGGFFSSTKKFPKISPVTCLFDATTNYEQPAICGFSAGKAAIEWADFDSDLRKAEIIESLVNYFGNEARDYIDYSEKNWANEFLSGGCPTLSVTSFGCMEDYPKALREPFLNVHFAGTESATEWQGLMDGACESGERCALEVQHSLFDDLTQNDFEKTFYYQQKQIENILDINEKSRFKFSVSLMSKYFLLFGLIASVLYALFHSYFKNSFI